jgi:hypothetical protein
MNVWEYLKEDPWEVNEKHEGKEEKVKEKLLNDQMVKKVKN